MFKEIIQFFCKFRSKRQLDNVIIALLNHRREQNLNSSQSSQPLRNRPVQPSIIPTLESAKSYFTGSAGSISAKPSVIFTAVDKETAFRSWKPKILHNLPIWTSTGTISLVLSIRFHKPVSTASLRTIQRRKRFSLLQALPAEGWVSK